MPNPNKDMPTFKHFFLDAEPLPGKEVFKSVLCVCKKHEATHIFSKLYCLIAKHCQIIFFMLKNTTE